MREAQSRKIEGKEARVVVATRTCDAGIEDVWGKRKRRLEGKS